MVDAKVGKRKQEERRLDNSAGAKSRKGILLSGVYVEMWRAMGSYSIILGGGAI